MIIDVSVSSQERERYIINKNGREDGIYRCWRSNGNLLFEIVFKNGKAHQLHRFWDPEGKLTYDISSKN